MYIKHSPKNISIKGYKKDGSQRKKKTEQIIEELKEECQNDKK